MWGRVEYLVQGGGVSELYRTIEVHFSNFYMLMIIIIVSVAKYSGE